MAFWMRGVVLPVVFVPVPGGSAPESTLEPSCWHEGCVALVARQVAEPHLSDLTWIGGSGLKP